VKFPEISDRAQAITAKVLLALGLLLAFLTFFQPAGNPDFFWHLSAGKFITENFAFPRADFLSWSRAGAPWVDFEWLSQVIYQLLWRAGGLWAEYALKILLLAGALAAFALHMRLYRAADKVWALAPLWAAALLPSLDIRPENFTLLFFVLEFYLLDKIRLAAEMPRALPVFGISLAGFALWGNLHAGCVYGALLAAFFAAGEYARRDIARARLFSLVTLAAALGPLANPYGAGIYRVALAHYGDMASLQDYILEWQPASVLNMAQRPYWFLVAVCLGALLWRSIRHKDVPPAHLMAALYFGLASSRYSRQTMFFAAVAVPVSVCALGAAHSPRLKTAWRLALALIFAATAAHLAVWMKDSLGKSPWKNSATASGAVNYLAANRERLAPLRMYNPWGWGGYIGYKLYPGYRIFQDGRYIFHGNLEEIYRAETGPAHWAEFMDTYGFGLVVLNRLRGVAVFDKATRAGRTVILKRPHYLVYMPKDRWALVYWDAYALVFVRRAAADGGWLEENSYAIARPDDEEAVSAALSDGEIDAGQFEAELARLQKSLSASGALGDTRDEFNRWRGLGAR